MTKAATQQSDATSPAAQAISDRMSAALNDMHSFALDELSAIEGKVARLKHAIVLQKNRSQQEAQIYIDLLNTAMGTVRDLDAAVNDIARTITVDPHEQMRVAKS